MWFLGAIGLAILCSGIIMLLIGPVSRAWDVIGNEIECDLYDLEVRTRTEIINEGSTVRGKNKYGVVFMKKFVDYFDDYVYVVIWHGTGNLHDSLLRLFNVRNFTTQEKQAISQAINHLGNKGYVSVHLVCELEPV